MRYAWEKPPKITLWRRLRLTWWFFLDCSNLETSREIQERYSQLHPAPEFAPQPSLEQIISNILKKYRP